MGYNVYMRIKRYLKRVYFVCVLYRINDYWLLINNGLNKHQMKLRIGYDGEGLIWCCLCCHLTVRMKIVAEKRWGNTICKPMLFPLISHHWFMFHACKSALSNSWIRFYLLLLCLFACFSHWRQTFFPNVCILHWSSSSAGTQHKSSYIQFYWLVLNDFRYLFQRF